MSLNKDDLQTLRNKVGDNTREGSPDINNLTSTDRKDQQETRDENRGQKRRKTRRSRKKSKLPKLMRKSDKTRKRLRIQQEAEEAASPHYPDHPVHNVNYTIHCILNNIELIAGNCKETIDDLLVQTRTAIIDQYIPPDRKAERKRRAKNRQKQRTNDKRQKEYVIQEDSIAPYENNKRHHCRKSRN